MSTTVTEVALPLVTFESATTVGGEVVASASTLRFRESDEVERDLNDHGFDAVDVRDALTAQGRSSSSSLAVPQADRKSAPSEPGRHQADACSSATGAARQ